MTRANDHKERQLRAEAKRSSADRDGSGLPGFVPGRGPAVTRAASPSAKGSGAPSAGSSRTLRLALLAATTALFFLFAAAAQASAETITIEGAPGGTGEGTITVIHGGTGTDPLNCHVVGESASGDCTTFAEGVEELEFLATPEGGSSFEKWEFSGSPPGTTCEESPTSNPCGGTYAEFLSANIKAKFAGPPNVTIEASPASTGEGTVTVTHYGSSVDPLNCHIVGPTASGDCTTSIVVFEEIEFHASGEGGSSFVEWTGTGALAASPCNTGQKTSTSCEAGLGQAQFATLQANFSAPIPTVVTEAATGVGVLGATANGKVNPNSLAVTECKFEYVTEAAFQSTGFTDLSSGGSAACVPSPGSGASFEPVSASLSSLTAGTTYRFRLVAANSNGTSNGPALSFTTEPAVQELATEAATAIGTYAATLNGTLNPNSLAVTECKFEYVTEAAFQSTGFTDLSSGGSSACVSSPGSGSSPVAVSASVSGLHADTGYDFRLVASNSNGTTSGSALNFTTEPIAFTDAASAIHHTDAVLNGHFDPSGDPGITHCQFDWGTTTAYSGGSVPCDQGNSFAGPASVTATLGFLSAGTTYHFRLDISTTSHGDSLGHDRSFTPLLPDVAHNFITAFGPNGTSATSFNVIDQLAFDQVHHKLYSLDDNSSFGGVPASIYGFDASAPPAFPPLAGFNPLGTGVPSGSPPGLAVDNSGGAGGGHVYYVSESTGAGRKVFGYDASGAPLGGSFPLNPTADYGFVAAICGVAVDSNGNIAVASGFTAKSGDKAFFRYSPTGAYQAAVELPGSSEPCRLAFDSGDDLYVAADEIGGVEKYTAASGYASHTVINSEAAGLAVDRGTDHLYTTQDPAGVEARVREYDSSGKLFSEFATGVAGARYRGVAVDESNGDVYVADKGNEKIRVYGPAIVSPQKPTLTPGAPTAITPNTATLNAKVDPETIAVTDCHFDYGTTTSYGQTAPCAPSPGSGSGDVAVSANLSGLTAGTTYHFRIVASNAQATATGADQTLVTSPAVKDVVTNPATAITGAAATLHGSLDPNGAQVTDCHFEYVTDADFQSGGFTGAAQSPSCTPDPGSGSGAVAVSAAVSGLNGGTTYHFRIVASNAAGTTPGGALTFTTHGGVIGSQSVESVGTSDANVSAKINPAGEATTYHVEYGTTSAYGQSTPESQPFGAPGDESAHTLSAHIGGLNPGATYHFRFVATNAGGTSAGADTSFGTFPAKGPGFAPCPNDQFRSGFGAALPDCRAYEQVTPTDKHGANVHAPLPKIEASSAGNRIDFYLEGGLPTSGGSAVPSPFLASRGPSGWSSDGLLPPSDPGLVGTEVIGWSADMSRTLTTAPLAGSGGAENAFFLRDSDTGAFQQSGPVFPEIGQTSLAGFAADTSHLIFETTGQVGLLPEAIAGKDNLYDLDHGNLTLAGRIPAGSATSCDDASGPTCVPAPEGSFAGPYQWQGNDLNDGGAASTYYTENTISRDGSKVFFTAAGTGKLYMREDGTKTTWISASQRSAPDPNGTKPAAFVAATRDGSEVFFTSCEKLTDDSTAVSTFAADRCHESAQGSDLYSYDTETGELTDLTVDSEAGDAKGADVLGLLGASEDGSYVYFVANGVLAAGASPGANLYLYHDGTTTFIAALRGESDSNDWSTRVNESAQNYLKTARVAASGKAVLFSSVRSLTGYDNAGKAEFYRYSATTGQLDCVSCDPTGLPPLGRAEIASEPVPIALGFNLPGAFLTRNLSTDGNRAFFETPDALVPGDTNGVQDVYEWEAKGSGSCESEGQDGGCIYLISSGRSSSRSTFGDASANGDHVFIFTAQPLVPGDGDELIDVYDAAVGGGLASQHQLAPPTCSSSACQANPAPPPEPSTASSAFQGPGNAHEGHAKSRRCPKGKRKVTHRGKVRCEAARKHKRHNNRGGSK
jgi:NHL repeat